MGCRKPDKSAIFTRVSSHVRYRTLPNFHHTPPQFAVARSSTETTDSADRIQAIVDSLLGTAAREGEMAVAWARLVLGVTVTLMWPIVHGENILNMVPRAVAVFVLGVLGLAWTLWVLYRLRNANPSAALIYTSITVDAVLVNALGLSYVIAPGPTHQSIAEVHGASFVYLAIVTAGVRLSPIAAYYGAALNSAMLTGLVIASTVLVDDFTIMGWAEWITVGIGLVGSTLLGITVATRTSRLVQQSASETLMSETARMRLGAYISPEVASVVLQESELRLGGQRQDVAVLFSDLRGFTTYSETLEPEKIVDQLNSYMSAMVDTISRNGGIVDKFMGDGIMAVFGAPVSKSGDADRAVECALAMMEAIDLHNQARAGAGLPQLRHGIGIHYGPVVAGNVGTAERTAYTVIGDTVNLASRLEAMTKQLDTDIAISQQTVEACSHEHNLRRVDEIHVPGREGAVTVWGPK